MQITADQGDEKLAAAVKETAKEEAHEAAEAGIREAKEDVAAEEKKKV